MTRRRPRKITLDVGGEGRHADAWNLNPRAAKTIGPQRGEPIPRRIAGRAEAIPFADRSVDQIIMERTPLCRAALEELLRVVASNGQIALRHAVPPNFDPHALARQLLPGRVLTRSVRIGSQTLQETRFLLGAQALRRE